MRCVICKSANVTCGTTTVVLERGGCAVVFRNVPADVCPNCGEAYTSNEIASRLLARAEQAIAAGAEIEIVRFAA